MAKFWNFKNTEEKSELILYGDISSQTWFGDEITPKLFKEELDKCKGDIDIYINSGGGDVFAGIGIYNMLTRYEGGKIVHIDGIAASIASVIAMAGDVIVMPQNATMMIHNAWTCIQGNKATIRKAADELERIDGQIAGIYAAKGGKDATEYAAMMEQETWFTAAEALEAGLIDQIEDDVKVAASMDDGFFDINGQKVEAARYAHTEVLESMVEHTDAVEPEASAEGHCNGEETQPVDDINTKLLEQQKLFIDTQRKIMERIEKE